MAASLAPHQDQLLTSWKEIASYLGKGVRTVQRWEQLFGLPVRRPNDKSKGIVRATCQELDSWLVNQWSQRDKGLPSVAPTSELWESVRVGIERSAELRRANSLLLADVRVHLENVIQECRAMARNMTGTLAPPDMDHL